MSTTNELYNEYLKQYLEKVEVDFNARRDGIGIALIIVRNDPDDNDNVEGMVDMATNLTPDAAYKVFSEILKRLDDECIF